MSYPIFIAQDLSLYTLSATDTDPDYPLSNLRSYIASYIWRSATTGEQYLKIDFGTPTEINTLVIHNNNFASLGIVDDSIELQCSSDNVNWDTLAWIAYEECPNHFYTSFTAQTKRYWRLFFPAEYGPMSTYPEIGNLFLSKAFDIGRPYEFPYAISPDEFKSVINFAINGLAHGSQAYGARPRIEITFSIGKIGLSDAVIANFQTFFATVRGRLRPFYFLDMDGTLYYCNLDIDKDPSVKWRANQNDVKTLPMFVQAIDTSPIYYEETTNTRPIAYASCATSPVISNQLITMNGSYYDADGDTCTYKWRKISGDAITFDDDTAQNPTFTFPAAVGTVVVGLQVYDGKQWSEEVEVSMTSTYGIITLYPSSTISNTAWTRNPGNVDFWETVDENRSTPNDGDYIFHNTTPPSIIFGLTDLPFAINDCSKIVIKVRHQRSSEAYWGLNYIIYTGTSSKSQTWVGTPGFGYCANEDSPSLVAYSYSTSEINDLKIKIEKTWPNNYNQFWVICINIEITYT